MKRVVIVVTLATLSYLIIGWGAVAPQRKPASPRKKAKEQVRQKTTPQPPPTPEPIPTPRPPTPPPTPQPVRPTPVPWDSDTPEPMGPMDETASPTPLPWDPILPPGSAQQPAPTEPSGKLKGQSHLLGELYDHSVVMPKSRMFAFARQILEAEGLFTPGTEAVGWASRWGDHSFPLSYTPFGTFTRSYWCAHDEITHNMAYKKPWQSIDKRIDVGPFEKEVVTCSEAAGAMHDKQTFSNRRWTFVRDPMARFVMGYGEITDRYEQLRGDGERISESCPVEKKGPNFDVLLAKLGRDTHLQSKPDAKSRAEGFIRELVSGQYRFVRELAQECVDVFTPFLPLDDRCARTAGYDFVGKLERFEDDLLLLRQWGHVKGKWRMRPNTWDDLHGIKGRSDDLVHITKGMHEVLADESNPHLHALCVLLYNDHVRFQYKLPEGCNDVTVKWKNPLKTAGTGVLDCSSGICALPPLRVREDTTDILQDLNIMEIQDRWDEVAETPTPDAEDGSRTPLPWAFQLPPGITGPPAPTVPDQPLTGDAHTIGDLHEHGLVIPKAQVFTFARRVLEAAGYSLSSSGTSGWARNWGKHKFPISTTGFGDYTRTFWCAHDDITHNTHHNKHWQHIDSRIDAAPGGNPTLLCGEQGLRKEPATFAGRRWTFVRNPLTRFVMAYGEIEDRLESLRGKGNFDVPESCPAEKRSFDDNPKFRGTHLHDELGSKERAEAFIRELVTGKYDGMRDFAQPCVDVSTQLLSMDDACARSAGYEFVGKLERVEDDLLRLRQWGHVKGKWRMRTNMWDDLHGIKGRSNDLVHITKGLKAVLADESNPHLHALCVLLYNDHVRFQYKLPEGCSDVEIEWQDPSKTAGTGVLDCSSGVCVLPPVGISPAMTTKSKIKAAKEGLNILSVEAVVEEEEKEEAGPTIPWGIEPVAGTPAPASAQPVKPLEATEHSLSGLYDHGVIMPKSKQFGFARQILESADIDLADRDVHPDWWRNWGMHVYQKGRGNFGSYTRTMWCAHDDFDHNMRDKKWAAVSGRIDPGPTTDQVVTCGEDKGTHKIAAQLENATFAGRRWTFVRNPMTRFIKGYAEIQDRLESIKKNQDHDAIHASCPKEKMGAKFAAKFQHTHVAQKLKSKARAEAFIRDVVDGEFQALRDHLTADCGDMSSFLLPLEDRCSRAAGYEFVGKVENLEDDLKLLRRWGHLKGTWSFDDWEELGDKSADLMHIAKGMAEVVQKDPANPYFKALCIMLYNDHVRFQYKLPEGCNDVTVKWKNPLKTAGTGVLDCSSGICVLPPVAVRSQADDVYEGLNVLFAKNFIKSEPLPTGKGKADTAASAEPEVPTPLPWAAALPPDVARKPVPKKPTAPLDGNDHSIADLYRHQFVMPKSQVFDAAARVLKDGGVKLGDAPDAAWKNSWGSHSFEASGSNFGKYIRTGHCAAEDIARNVKTKKYWQMVDKRIDGGPTETKVMTCSAKRVIREFAAFKDRRWTFVRDPLARFIMEYGEVQDRFDALQQASNKPQVKPTCPREKMGNDFDEKVASDFKGTHLSKTLGSKERAQLFIHDLVTGQYRAIRDWAEECSDVNVLTMEDSCGRTAGYEFVGKIESFAEDLQLLRQWGHVLWSWDISRWEEVDGGTAGRSRELAHITQGLIEVTNDPESPYLHALCVLLYNDYVRFQYKLPEGCNDVEIKWEDPSKTAGTGVLDCSSGVCMLPPVRAVTPTSGAEVLDGLNMRRPGG